MKNFFALLLLTLTALAGCAHVISDESRRLVDPGITFSMLKEKPDSYTGKYVMLGGVIAGIKNTKEGSQLEVMQVRLDDSGMPEDTFRTEGRFLATTDRFLDSMIFKPGRLVTAVGEVRGKKTVPLDEVDYTYPVIAIREIHVWKSYDYEQGYPYPTPAPYYYYDPYYYGFWPGPYWYRPLGPVYRRW
ncbi:Slp family lipoprotein [Geobacter pickeringii]|uniref:Membrane protein n=1 Tax=Geobacter pickeringii TaxID=345632 RepID=A0A0B5BEW3_9BACT|nr:Slp family lipoprotein [Geobacter pickeringii]AJE03070.1 membrane protein [Geobacter pickeringii]